MNSTYTSNYICGSTAAKIVRPTFKLIEGGLNGACSEKQTQEQHQQVTSPKVIEEPNIRIIELVMGALVAFTLIFSFIQTKAHTNWVNATLSSMPVHSRIIHTGDSIWEIAEDSQVEQISPKEMVSYICEVNQIDPGKIMPGDVIMVPGL